MKFWLVMIAALILLAPLSSPIASGQMIRDQPAAKPTAAANQFGIKPEGITSAEMRDALNQLQEAGKVDGRRGSLTFFRWTDSTPPKLSNLGLWGTKVSNQSLILTAALPDLERVSLHETSVDDEGISLLAKLSQLRTLTISPIIRYEKPGYGAPQWSYPFMERVANRPRVTGKALAALVGLKNLESLDLLDVTLATDDLATLTAWPKLSSLSLPSVINDETFKHLRACRRLSALTIGHREISAEELRCLATWKSLRKLTVIHTRLSEESLRTLSQLESVQELVLEDCGLTDTLLQNLRGSPSLKQLILERNEIDGPGLVHIAKLNLQTLGLEFNNISDKTLSHLTQLTSLENLWLSYCRQVTDSGIQSGTLQKMKHLKQLRLRGMTQVTDASLESLVHFGHLEQITIRETKISAAGVAKMKQAMPNTNVFK